MADAMPGSSDASRLPLVHYFGPPLAGLLTSLSAVVGDSRARGDVDHEVRLPSGPVHVRTSSLAGKFHYDETTRPEFLEPVFTRLAEASGIVFVVESQDVLRERNTVFLDKLRAELHRKGVDLDELPVVFQLNKRDLPELTSVADLKVQLRTRRCEYVESVAAQGVGTMLALTTVVRMMDWSMSIRRYSKAAFERADDAGKVELASELGELLAARLRRASDFNREVRVLVPLLRALGHDLWSFDDDGEEMSAWGPNYATPTGAGIVVTFTSTRVEVGWALHFGGPS